MGKQECVLNYFNILSMRYPSWLIPNSWTDMILIFSIGPVLAIYLTGPKYILYFIK